ncbi:hypothetical protein [Azorhizophilus paspali]|uniref:KTSC domain-containing protein n=1 Tax=Azorhizophilus paspali TaxID=69963 RepID=A0ABV6SPN5_AZOPA
MKHRSCNHNFSGMRIKVMLDDTNSKLYRPHQLNEAADATYQVLVLMEHQNSYAAYYGAYEFLDYQSALQAAKQYSYPKIGLYRAKYHGIP